MIIGQEPFQVLIQGITALGLLLSWIANFHATIRRRRGETRTGCAAAGRDEHDRTDCATKLCNSPRELCWSLIGARG